MKKLILLALLTGLLGGCATYTDRTSPCVCDWESIEPEREIA